MVGCAKGGPLTAGLVGVVLATFILTGCGGGASPVRQADLGGLNPPIAVTVAHASDWTVTLTSTQILGEVTLYFDDGSAETFPLSGLTQVVHSGNPAGMSYLKASTKGGDYWYFDNAGTWLPDGYKPKYWSSLSGKGTRTVWVDGNALGITCSDTYSQVKVYYQDDTTQVFDTSEASGTYDLVIPGYNVAAIRITLQADGSRYYYKADGSELPAGTKWYEDAD